LGVHCARAKSIEKRKIPVRNSSCKNLWCIAKIFEFNQI
jgi:hypothetical protein